MVSYIHMRRSEGRLPVPLRYIAGVVFILFMAVWIWPNAEVKTSDSQNNTLASEEIQREDHATYAAASFAAPIAQEVKKTAPNEQAASAQKGHFAPPASRRVNAVLASFSPKTGLPVEHNGIYLPEPRPATLHHRGENANEVKRKIDFLRKEGVRPYMFEVQSGDTLGDTLVSALEISYDEVNRLINSIASEQDPRAILPGQKISAYTVKGETGNILMAIEMQRDVVTNLSAVRVSQNRFATAEIKKPVVKNVRAVNGSIENSLYVAANGQGVPDRVIVDLIRVYSWSIDFQRDIRVNDSFEIMYEEYRTEDGELVPGKGDVLYASLSINNRPHTMYRYESKEHGVDYFEEDGQSVRKALMTTPINGARLSSGFGNRKHPILGYNRMHRGVDFAAPTGTPIYASGDGVIEFIGPRGSFGNYILIRHRQDLKTAYAHLHGFKSGLRQGSRVRQGDTIGYVGTTGSSTGPHLHYEVHLNGKAVNPASVNLPTGNKLTGTDLRNFKTMVKDMQKNLEKLGLGKTRVALHNVSATATN